MKKYGLKYHPSVKSEDLPRLSADIKQRIRKSIEDKLATAPHEYGLPLRKTLKGYWKLRVGDCRVVYKVAWGTVMIFCIAHRKEIYQKAEKRE
ncbi:MAG: type II toxin-antitoxin system RelE family toxin [Desulfonatronovibrio sp.]